MPKPENTSCLFIQVTINLWFQECQQIEVLHLFLGKSNRECILSIHKTEGQVGCLHLLETENQWWVQENIDTDTDQQIRWDKAHQHSETAPQLPSPIGLPTHLPTRATQFFHASMHLCTLLILPDYLTPFFNLTAPRLSSVSPSQDVTGLRRVNLKEFPIGGWGGGGVPHKGTVISRYSTYSIETFPFPVTGFARPSLD